MKECPNCSVDNSEPVDNCRFCGQEMGAPSTAGSAWVETSERLPDDYECVLTMFEGEGWSIASQVDGEWRWHTTMRDPDGRRYIVNDIGSPTHWMPIPEYPKQNDKK